MALVLRGEPQLAIVSPAVGRCNCDLVEKSPSAADCPIYVDVDFEYNDYTSLGVCEFGPAPCPVVFHCWFEGKITITSGAFTDINAAGAWQGQTHTINFDLTQCGHFNYEWIEVWDDLHSGIKCEFEVGIACNSCNVNY